MKCDTPFYIQPKGYVNAIPVRCGQCPPCKRARVASWSFRLQQEERVSSSCFFITLTYDTDHVPITKSGLMTLCQRDWQTFMKRLRKAVGSKYKLKYYCAGEYGDLKKRPHYHVVLFNMPTDDFINAGKDSSGHTRWSSKVINDAWGKGIVDITTTGSGAMAYTAKYIDKAKRVPMFNGDDREKEKSYQSKGLGKNYLNATTTDFHRKRPTDLSIYVPGGHRIGLPRYYRNKIWNEPERKRLQEYINSYFAGTWSEQELARKSEIVDEIRKRRKVLSGRVADLEMAQMEEDVIRIARNYVDRGTGEIEFGLVELDWSRKEHRYNTFNKKSKNRDL